MEGKDYDENDPNRHLRRIQKIVGVSGRIQTLALKRRQSNKVETKEEKEERILVRKKLICTSINQLKNHRKMQKTKDQIEKF